MSDLSLLGKLLLVIGMVIAALGLILFLAGKVPWIGRLPGDFVYRGKSFTLYFPLMTSLIASVILSMVLWFISRR
jgi:tellurite resistance protein TehA-like permease